MTMHASKWILTIAIALSIATTGKAQTPTSPQPTIRPFSLPLISQTQLTGSDSRAAAFNSDYLPRFRQIINDNLSESVVFTGVSGFKLDSSKFFLLRQSPYPIRVYFLAEGAGFWNTLGFAFTPAGQAQSGTPYLIFPNASDNPGRPRTLNTPVREGDFVDIGVGGNGWQLDFFLIADGARSGRTWYWNDIDKNGDGLQHVVAFLIPNSPFILVGFEDLWGGGDRDYNDILYVVDIGLENARLLQDTSFPH